MRNTPNQRIIVTGSSGLLGRSLLDVLSRDFEVVGMDKEAAGTRNDLRVDLAQRSPTTESIVRIAPRVIIHAAAETNVDLCESDQDLARRINVDGTRNIVAACANLGTRLILISTDYVFDGIKGNYAENDQPNPISFYGLTKLEAERLVSAGLSDYLITRTSVLYGWHPSKLNFATWVLKGLREQQRLKVVNDHFNSPTLARNLAEAIRIAIVRETQGILHVAGRERISRFDFALRIAKTFDLNESLLVPVQMRDLNWIARRPRDSSLNVGKAEKELGIELLGVDGGLEEMARSRP